MSWNQVTHATGQRRRTICAGLLRTISRRIAVTFSGVEVRSKSAGCEAAGFCQRIARKLLIGELHCLRDERDGMHEGWRRRKPEAQRF